MRSGWWKVFAIVTVLALTGCAGSAGSGGIEVQDAWVRAIGSGAGMDSHGSMSTAEPGSMTGLNSAAYMVIRNGGAQADRLLRVESDAAAAVELHKSELQNEIMTMRPVDTIEIPAGGSAALEPGGLHVMLIGVKAPLTAGEKVSLTLVFEQAGEMLVEADIRAP